MSLPWFRMYAEAVDDEKLRLLAFEDRWHFFAVLCCKAQGIQDSNSGDLLDRKIGVKLELREAALSECKRRLIESTLIDDSWQPIAWNKRQFQSDSAKERVRKYRERKKKKTCNADVTLPKRNGNVTVTAQDTDTDTEQIKP